MCVELDAVQEVFDKAAHENLRLGESEAGGGLGDRSEVADLLQAPEEEGSEDCLGVDVVGVSPVGVSAEVEEGEVVP